MYRALIVDDEPLMLRYLETNLEKLDSRWKVCASAQNGTCAAELLSKDNFDLVITDIRMPEMDGLALARYIRENGFKSKVLLISGHDDFEYARQAVRCGVHDYLLKPIVDSDLKNALNSIAERISEEALQDTAVKALRTLSSDSFKDIKSTFLSALLRENQKEINALYPVLHKMQVSILDGWGAIMVLRPDTLALARRKASEENRLICQIMVRELCEENAHSDLLFCEDSFGNIVFLMTSEHEEDLLAQALALKSKLERECSGKNNIPLSASLGGAVNDIFALSGSYQSAIDAFIQSSDEIKPIHRIESISQRRYADTVKGIARQMLIAQKFGDDAAILTGTGALISAFPKPYPTELCILSAFGFAAAAITDETAVADNFESAHFRMACVLIGKTEITEQDIETACVAFLRRLSANGCETLTPSVDVNTLAETVKEYICLHYNEPLSLAFLSDKFGVTPAYLSDLFHKSIGEAYTKFLTRIRMEQSTRILRSEPQTKIYSIAEQVGFVSVKHFNAVFKKYYGMSPKNFQRVKF